MCGFWQIPEPWSLDVTLTNPATQPLQDAAPTGRKNQGGEPWRALLHAQAEGRKLNRVVLAALSAAYYTLFDEDSMFIVLVRHARSQWDLCYRALGARRRQCHRAAKRATRDDGRPVDGEPDGDGAEEGRRFKLDDALRDMPSKRAEPCWTESGRKGRRREQRIRHTRVSAATSSWRLVGDTAGW